MSKDIDREFAEILKASGIEPPDEERMFQPLESLSARETLPFLLRMLAYTDPFAAFIHPGFPFLGHEDGFAHIDEDVAKEWAKEAMRALTEWWPANEQIYWPVMRGDEVKYLVFLWQDRRTKTDGEASETDD